MTFAALSRNIEYGTEHEKAAYDFCLKVKELLIDGEFFVYIAGTNSIYVTVYKDEDQNEERVYRFSDHANCRRYTSTKNVAPSCDSLEDVIFNVKEFLG